MLGFLPHLFSGDAPRLLLLGAHCDDIEIGCGGTLQHLARRWPDARVTCVVFSSNPQREGETRAALGELLSGFAASDVRVLRFRNGYFPFVGAEIKDYFENLKSEVAADLVFTHAREDRHQDHRTISDLTWNTFRDHLVLEYEIAKYDGDLGQPNAFVPLESEVVETKIRCLMRHFASQHSKSWFTEETFRALLRLRGVECNAASGYAEAFFLRKARLGL
jgi:LmbE family N-acetylglucosaminyl deacetylase